MDDLKAPCEGKGGFYTPYFILTSVSVYLNVHVCILCVCMGNWREPQYIILTLKVHIQYVL